MIFSPRLRFHGPSTQLPRGDRTPQNHHRTSDAINQPDNSRPNLVPLANFFTLDWSAIRLLQLHQDLE